MKKYKFLELSSTNTYLKENFSLYDNYTIIQTEHQTAGKGRLGRTWLDQTGCAMFSILIKEEVESLEVLPLIVAMSVHQVLSKKVDNLEIKWPNDLLVNQKKLVGILVETIIQEKIEAIIIGIGINVNNDPTTLNVNATSIFNETNINSDIDKLIDEVTNQIQTNINIDRKLLVDYLNKYLSIKNQEIVFVYNNEEYSGTAIQILSDGSLEVVTPKEVMHLFSGEVTLHKKQI